MIFVSSDQLITWITSFIWPLTRILGLIAIAPIFGNSAIPVRVKISFGIMLALIVAPTLHDLPHVDPVSLPGMLILAQQFIIGIAMGFTIQIVFASVDLAGNLIGMAMGLGFASFLLPVAMLSTTAGCVGSRSTVAVMFRNGCGSTASTVDAINNPKQNNGTRVSLNNSAKKTVFANEVKQSRSIFN